jgi:group II intron reverse transcriptase/maturase
MYLRLKLNCLIFLPNWFGGMSQSLYAVSFQHAVGNTNRIEHWGSLMMCPPHERMFGKPTMSGIEGTNGKPKDTIFSYLLGILRRIKRTSGSSISESMRAHACITDALDDGGSVVPAGTPPNSPSGGNGGRPPERDPGKQAKSKGKISVPEASPETRKKAESIVQRWVQRQGYYTGVNIPRKFAKVLVRGQNINSHFDSLYPLLLSPAMFDLAYGKVKSNPGMMTKGSTEETLSGWGPKVRDSIISKLKDESFQFTPARLLEVPKPDGSKRPLKMGSPRDKIVQRVLTNILEAIYEPAFSPFSFGFRPHLGCHNALEHIEKKYQGTRWFIEGDIAKCFDEIDHHALIGVIRKRIKDERFIRLLWKALRAGVMDSSNIPKDCIIGTPQGSIVSPILCNIFLSEFDEFVENVLMPKYNRGVTRAQPPKYMALMARSYYYGKRYAKSKDPDQLELCRNLRAEAQKLPSTEPKDPNFRRLYYTRYADDWLIGFAGPICEAETIRDECKDFFTSIKLRLNMEKTLISSGQDGCIYLGTKIHVPLNQERFKKGAKHKARANLGVRLNAPLARVIKKLASAGYCTKEGIPTPRMALYADSKEEIVGKYAAVLRGILNYYSFADNLARLVDTVFYILRGSAAKILAAKLKLKTARQVLIKLGPDLAGADPDGSKVLPLPRDIKQLYKAKGKRFSIGQLSSRIPLYRKAELTVRIAGIECAVCGSTHNVEMHHVRQLKDLTRRLDPIAFAMAARSRKQIPLCRIHHIAQHVNLNKVRVALAKKDKLLSP